MFKRVLYLIALTFLVSPLQRSYGQFPYQESFRNSTAPGIRFGGNPNKAFLTAGSPVVGDPEGEGFLRLTNSSNDQTGYIFSDASFPSKYGLKLELEYYIYGGNGADGITFFLFDASVPVFNPGAFGGSLGYAQKHDPNVGVIDSPGVSRGYLGIGLDEYGNFSNPTEGRQGGVIGSGPGGISPSSITLRGKGNGHFRDSENYKYLTSVKTDTLGFLLTEGDSRQSDSTKKGYRRVLVDLQPAAVPLTGYLITVKITTGGAPTKTYTVISNYHYPDQAPENLKYGIASSTGFLTNIHEIRNVFIDVFDKSKVVNPISRNDAAESCFDQPSTIAVLANDNTSNAGGTLILASIDLDPTQSGIQRSFTVENKGSFTANDDGTVTFTPLNAAVSGPVTVRYTVSDSYGKTSSPATLTINPKPKVAADAGPDQSISIETPFGSATLMARTSSGTSGAWSQVSGPPAIISSKTVSNPTVSNLVPGTYIFRWTVTGADLCSNSDDVQILVINPAIQIADDVAPPSSGGPIDIDVTSNDTDANGNIVKGTVVITEPPLHGTVTVDPVTGKVRYTPNPGYSGPDSFTYVIKDDTGGTSQPGKVKITVLAPAKIGLAKAVATVSQALNGTYDVDFIFTLRNFGGDPLERISLQDDLGEAFSGAEVKVLELKVVGTGLVPNTAYNGTTNTELLSNTSTLAAGAIELVSLKVNIKLVSREGLFNNSAFATGFSTLFNSEVMDQSTNGLRPDPRAEGDVSYSDPTPLELKAPPLFIPGGFSPNNDGKNDRFVIQNKLTKKISVEIFNRWGNRVYRSTDYQNDWDSSCTEGITVGRYVPSGTYYYVIVVDDKEKYAGFLTINR